MTLPPCESSLSLFLSVGVADNEDLSLVVGLPYDCSLVTAMVFPFLLTQ